MVRKTKTLPPIAGVPIVREITKKLATISFAGIVIKYFVTAIKTSPIATRKEYSFFALFV